MAVGGDADEVDEVVGRGGFQQESGGARAQRPDDVVVGVEGGERDDDGRVAVGGDAFDGGQAVDAAVPARRAARMDILRAMATE